MDIIALYVQEEKSIPEIQAITGLPASAIRKKLKDEGVIRSRADALRLAAKKGRLGSGLRGKTRVFSEQWKKNISTARKANADAKSVGVRITKSGYVEFTRGENKGRGQHVVVVEKMIGRRLFANEVVHHVDGDKKNNILENLKLMTRAEHSSLHAFENAQKRKRKNDGKFE